LGILLSAGTAFLISINTEPVYSSTTFLLLEQPAEQNSVSLTELEGSRRLAETYVQLIQKQPVYQAVIDRLGLPYTPSQLGNAITVSQVPNTGLISIEIEDGQPENAAIIANTLIEVFQEIDSQRQRARYADAIVGWENALEEADFDIQVLQAELNTLPNGDFTRQTQLESQLTKARDTYNAGFTELQNLRLDLLRNSSQLTVVEPAVANEAPIRPRTITNTLLAAIVGGMLALGIIFLIDFLDDKLRFPTQISEETGLSTIGAIPHMAATKESKPLTQIQPRSPSAEAFRLLRTNLNFFAVDKQLKRLLVTSAIQGEGKTTTAANLAVVMAQAGKRVLLVDADLRRPRLHKIFKVPNNAGLTNLLVDPQGRSLGEFLQKTETPGLKIMTSGPIPPNPAELLGSQRMHETLKELENYFDAILLDTPPVLTVADSTVLAPMTDGVMLISRIGFVDMAAVVQAVNMLQAADTPITGIVANDFSQKRGGYYYYTYYTYQYQYGGPASEKSRLARMIPGWLMNLFP
ncbi:MAG: polysaccharide biosynthesis tyrosine autokinase, partial [Chloroflexota bacterium]